MLENMQTAGGCHVFMSPGDMQIGLCLLYYAQNYALLTKIADCTQNYSHGPWWLWSADGFVLSVHLRVTCGAHVSSSNGTPLLVLVCKSPSHIHCSL